MNEEGCGMDVSELLRVMDRTQRIVIFKDGCLYQGTVSRAPGDIGSLNVEHVTMSGFKIVILVGRKEMPRFKPDEVNRVDCVSDGRRYVIHEMECPACGRPYEHVYGDYEFCPHCGAALS